MPVGHVYAEIFFKHSAYCISSLSKGLQTVHHCRDKMLSPPLGLQSSAQPGSAPPPVCPSLSAQPMLLWPQGLCGSSLVSLAHGASKPLHLLPLPEYSVPIAAPNLCSHFTRVSTQMSPSKGALTKPALHPTPPHSLPSYSAFLFLFLKIVLILS